MRSDKNNDCAMWRVVNPSAARFATSSSLSDSAVAPAPRRGSTLRPKAAKLHGGALAENFVAATIRVMGQQIERRHRRSRAPCRDQGARVRQCRGSCLEMTADRPRASGGLRGAARAALGIAER